MILVQCLNSGGWWDTSNWANQCCQTFHDVISGQQPLWVYSSAKSLKNWAGGWVFIALNSDINTANKAEPPHEGSKVPLNKSLVIVEKFERVLDHLCSFCAAENRTKTFCFCVFVERPCSINQRVPRWQVRCNSKEFIFDWNVRRRRTSEDAEQQTLPNAEGLVVGQRKLFEWRRFLCFFSLNFLKVNRENN